MDQVQLIRVASPTFSTETRVRSVVSKMPKADDALFKAPTSPFFVKQLGGKLAALFMLHLISNALLLARRHNFATIRLISR
jgi:hypothetical protein